MWHQQASTQFDAYAVFSESSGPIGRGVSLRVRGGAEARFRSLAAARGMKGLPADAPWLFRAASQLTDRFPRAGARVLDALVGGSLGNPLMRAGALAEARRAVGRVRSFRRVLVVADLNIGDAVVLQAALAGVRDYLPGVELEYAVSLHARALVEGNPETTAVHAIFTGAGTPVPGDVEAVRRIAVTRGYDLIINFSPFLAAGTLAPAGTPVVGFASLAGMIVRALRDPTAVAHVAVQTHRFMHRLFAPVLSPAREQPFAGVSVRISAEAAERSVAFVRRVRTEGEALVLLNPEASSRFTRIPLDVLTQLLRGLVRLPCAVVVGAGHAQRGLEERLIGALRPAERGRVRVLPASTPLDAYAAVVDAADVFLTADTGPSHVAAAWKESVGGGRTFRNRTSVMSIFGATEHRLYGYASYRPGFLPAHQAAPSFAFSAPSPCRNLSCIHKTAKTCRQVRCFEGLDARAVLAEVERRLSGGVGRAQAPAAPRLPH